MTEETGKSVSVVSVKDTIILVKEQPVLGGGINETQEDNTLCDFPVIYEF